MSWCFLTRGGKSWNRTNFPSGTTLTASLSLITS
uniref:Uncharacterized protein n=1 Tax=Rhizophora mucronata TaxID=61149 RepID=A0A2P2PT14_RHIMU